MTSTLRLQPSTSKPLSPERKQDKRRAAKRPTISGGLICTFRRQPDPAKGEANPLCHN